MRRRGGGKFPETPTSILAGLLLRTIISSETLSSPWCKNELV